MDQVEMLEERVLLSAVIETKGGRSILHVGGTRHEDQIVIALNPAATHVQITLNGQAHGSFTLTDITDLIQVRGGRDDDLIRVDDSNGIISKVVDLRGGAGSDTLLGSAGAETMRGGSHRDTLEGGAGNDTLRGELDLDSVRGGDGDDYLEAWTEGPVLFGEAGNDTLVGRSGRDLLFGGPGNDRMDGGDGDDLLVGGEGHDRLYGAKGRDTLLGDEGNDTLRGAQKADDLLGGAGTDQIYGNQGIDIFHQSDALSEILDRDVNGGIDEIRP